MEKKKTYLEKFLRKTVAADQQRDIRIEELRYKTEILDNISQPRKYNLRPKNRKLLSSKEKKRLKVFKLDPKQACYEQYTPLHELWKDYMRDLIKFDKISAKNLAEAEMRLLKADFHGAVVKVTKSTCPSLVGATGIILQETKHTFNIVTRENRLKTLPKRNTVFSIECDGYMFTIYGNNFQYRASDRAARNFKSKHCIDL